MSNQEERQNRFCRVCGHYISGFDPCPYCHSRTHVRMPEFVDIENGDYALARTGSRSAMTAGFLQLFLGVFGIGRFYLGYKKMGVIQIISSVLTMGAAGFVWGLADGILILSGKEKYDAEGKLLK